MYNNNNNTHVFAYAIRSLLVHNGDYQAFNDKDKETINSVMFNALMIVPFEPVKPLVIKLLELGIPVTIKDEVSPIVL